MQINSPLPDGKVLDHNSRMKTFGGKPFALIRNRRTIELIQINIKGLFACLDESNLKIIKKLRRKKRS